MDTNRIAGGQADRPADAPAHGMDGSVNRHYLNKVLDLADVMPVVATEDIYDSHGMKLLAKGAGVSRLLQEKIILHKLKKPIESTLVVEGGVDATTLVRTAKRVIDTCAPLDNILRATCIGGFTPLTTLSNMSFGNAITMMLTISERDGSQAFEHALIVSLLSICWAKKLHFTEQEQQIAGLAGLLKVVLSLGHDQIPAQPEIGELNPLLSWDTLPVVVASGALCAVCRLRSASAPS